MTYTMMIAGLILVVCVVARRVEGSWVAPAAFFPAVWAALVAGFSLLFPSLDEYYVGSLWILIACVAVLGGTFIARGREVEQPAVDLRFDPRSHLPLLVSMVLIANLAGIIEIAYLFARRGANPFSTVDIVKLVVANRAGTYGWNEWVQQPGEWLAFLLSYTGALFGGVLYRVSRVWWESALGLLAVVLIAVEFALYGSRFGALYGGSFFLAANLATAQWIGRSRGDSAKHLLRFGFLALMVLGGGSVGIQVIRYWTLWQGLGWRSILADGFSYIGAFSIWFRDHGLVWSDLTWGARTFTKLVAPLGIHEPGLGSIDVAFTASNIYTVFRDVLEDFGVLGSLVFFAALGYLGRWAYVGLRARRLDVLPIAVTVYAFTLTSFATSIFFYTAPTAALAVFTVYFLAVSSPRVVSWPSPVPTGPVV